MVERWSCPKLREEPDERKSSARNTVAALQPREAPNVSQDGGECGVTVRTGSCTSPNAVPQVSREHDQ